MRKIQRQQLVGFQSGDILSAEESQYFDQLERLWDMLSDCVKGGRLTKTNLPKDYKPLVQQMAKLVKLEDEAHMQLERINQ